MDANQPEIVAALRKAGAEVTPLHTVGKGVSDLLVSFRQRWLVMECKAHNGDLNALQREWIGKQRGPVYVVKTPSEAVEILNMVRP